MKEKIKKRLMWIVFWTLLILAITIDSAASVPYNVTNLTNANNIYQQTKELNSLVGGYIGIGIILTVFSITFVVISGNFNSAMAGFGAASFIALLTSAMLLPLGFIGFNIFRIVLVLTGVSVFISFLANPN